MSIQLLVTMRQDLARRFSRDRSVFDVASITGAARSDRLIGAPGYAMRVSVDETEEGQLRGALESLFRVEPDYALETFSAPLGTRKRAIAGSGGAPFYRPRKLGGHDYQARLCVVQRGGLVALTRLVTHYRI